MIVGPPGVGKTTWAKRFSEKPALWVTHMDDLKLLTDEHKTIIFDDLDFQHMPRTAQIHIVDQENARTIHIRYKVIHIPANITKIFTANTFPFVYDEAINRRINLIRC